MGSASSLLLNTLLARDRHADVKTTPAEISSQPAPARDVTATQTALPKPGLIPRFLFLSLETGLASSRWAKGRSGEPRLYGKLNAR